MLTLVGTTLAATAQKKNAAQEIYDKLEEESHVLSLSFNKKMIDAIDSDVEWGDEMRYLQGDLNKVKLMLIEDGDDAPKMAKYIYKKLDQLGYKLTDLPEDAETDNEDKNVFLFTNKKGNRFTEAHLLIMEEDGGTIFLSVYGDIAVSQEKV